MGKKKTAYVNKNKKEKKELKELAYEKKKKEMKLCLRRTHTCSVSRLPTEKHNELVHQDTHI